MIQKRQLFFPSMARFLLKRIAANAANTAYRTGSLDADPQSGEPDVMWQSVCYIADTHQIWTCGTLFFGSADITIDDILSTVSENPVQNKVITVAIESIDTAEPLTNADIEALLK